MLGIYTVNPLYLVNLVVFFDSQNKKVANTLRHKNAKYKGFTVSGHIIM